MSEPKSNKNDSRQPAKPKSSSTRHDAVEDERAVDDERDAGSVADNKRTIIKPYAEKIGESEDNLRGRGEWYRRRTGGA